MVEHFDKQLIADYLKGDERSLEILIKRYLRPIYNFAFRQINDIAEAEEIVQDVFVKVWKNLNKFKDNKKFRPWLYKIAKNTSLDFLKKKSAIPFSYLDLETDNKFDNIKNNSIKSPADIFEQSFLANKLSMVIKTFLVVSSSMFPEFNSLKTSNK